MQTTTPRIALVTGANTGIGFEIARGLGEAGLRVLIGARNATDGEAAAQKLRDDGIDAAALVIEFGNPATVEAAAAHIASAHGRLDVLVNNAGINDPEDGPPSRAGIDAVRRTFDANFFGPLMLTQAVLPLLRKSAAPRIVNASSGLGSLQLNGDPAFAHAATKLMGYGASKAALNLMTVQLAAELKDAGFLVNAADPGLTSTNLSGHHPQGQSPRDGAQTAIRLALLPDGGATGGFISAAGTEPW